MGMKNIEQYLDNVKDECVVTLGSIIYYVYGHPRQGVCLPV